MEKPKYHTISECEIQASQIVERLEEAVEKASEAFNVIEQGGDAANIDENDLGLKGESWEQRGVFLHPTGRNGEELLKVIEDLIVYETGDEEFEPIVTAVAPLTPLGRKVLALQSAAAYGYALDLSHFHRINKRMHDDVTRWISHLFRLQNSHVYYHDDPLEGLLRLTRMILHLRFPKYLEDGYLGLTQQPVLYGAIPNSLAVLQLICRQLGLPVSCIQPMAPSATGCVDVMALRRLVAQDLANGRLPLLLLGDTGTAVTGHIEDLVQLNEICKQNKIWLHLRGHNLAALSLITAPSVPFYLADSVSLSLSSWLGLPALPTCTLFRHLESPPSRVTGASREDTLPLIAGLLPDPMTRRFTCLSLWYVLQVLGREGIRDRIRTSFLAAHQLWHKISRLPYSVRILSRQPVFTDEVLPLSEITSNPVTSPLYLFDATVTSIVFQFTPDGISRDESSNPNTESATATSQKPVPFTGRVPPYFDKLNSWMCQVLQREVPQVNVEVCDIEQFGLVVRVCPLEGILPMTEELVQTFYNSLMSQLDILQATVDLKRVFQARVEENPQLCLVELPGWAGLGGVRYLPAIPDEGAEQSEFNSQEELNKLNMEIVNKLRNSDSAFSLGESASGLVCVRFGMVTSETDVEELLSLVLAVGAQVEESARHLDTMVEIVKKGIETATLDLQKESDERLWQDGILRQVPGVGSIVNWWAPKSSETGVKGRSLDLQAGVVESTENIYRYHMQLQQGAAGGIPTPQPQVQTPIVPDAGKTGHSRSSSHASHSSQTSTTSNTQAQAVVGNAAHPSNNTSSS